MSPNLLLRIASAISTAIVGYFAGASFFQENQDGLFFFTQCVAFGALLLLTFILWLASKTAWGKRIVAIVQAVIAVVEADRGGMSDTQAREKAIDLVLESMPPGKLNSLLRMPWVGRQAIGALVDWLVSSTKALLKTLPSDTVSAQSALESAIMKSGRK